MGRSGHLGDLEELVLLAVLGLGDEAHGGMVRETLNDEADRSVSVSTVYVTLMRLEEKGFVRSWKGASTPERGGKAKRHYAVTPEGLAVVEEVRSIRARMWDRVGSDSPRTADA